MKKLTAILCLTIAVLLGSVGTSESADFAKGAAAYENGDYTAALREWKPLAERGNADAQTHLAAMYDEGLGVPQDYKIAGKWLRLAAEQEVSAAQNNLGFMYETREGVIQDSVYAYMWFSIAASSGLKEASGNRDTVGKQMISNQIEKEQRLARECVRKKDKGC